MDSDKSGKRILFFIIITIFILQSVNGIFKPLPKGIDFSSEKYLML